MTVAAASIVEGAEITVNPALSLGVEYNDNIFLDTDAAIHDYIGHVTPALYAKYAAPIWEWTVSYAYDYQHYLRNAYADDHVQRLSLTSTIRIVQDRIFLDVRDRSDRVSVSSVRDYAQDSHVTNVTDFNVFEINPYAVLLLTSRTTLTTGYEYRNVWYDDPQALDRTENTAYGDISRTLTETARLDASILSSRIDMSLQRVTRTTGLIGPRYEYREKSFFWGRIGLTMSDYEDGQRDRNLTWDAGIIHHLVTTTLSGETGRRWIDDAYLGERREDRYIVSLETERERTSAGISIALREYGSDLYTDERRYSTTADFSHYLTERLQGTYALMIDRYEQYPADGPDKMTIVYRTDVRFAHHISENVTLSLSYRYTDSYSQDTRPDNYEVNRVLVEIKKSF